MSQSIAALPKKISFEELSDFLALDARQPSSENWNEAVEMARKAYTKGNLSLVLGAGVSIAAGIPGWNGILQELLVKAVGSGKFHSDETSRALAFLFTKGFDLNNLIAGRFLQNHFNDPDNPTAFEEAVRVALYKNANHRSNKLLDEIVNYCLAPGRSPYVSSIITYNFDDLLESSLSHGNTGVRYRSIYQSGDLPDSEEIPIYHVHGFLPRTGNIDQRSRVILSESLYHQQYGNSYDWSNLVQINTFASANCIFIGSSLTDPNQRRLLDVAKTIRGDSITHHFLVKRRHQSAALKKTLLARGVSRTKIDDESMNNLLEVAHSFEEKDAESFGVRILWVNNYDDIAGLLNEIRTGRS